MDFIRQGADMRFGLLVQIGNGQIGASGVEGFGATPGNAVNVRNADDKALEAFETGGVCLFGHGLFLNTV